MTLTLLEEKRAALKRVSKRLWEMSREAEMLACEVPWLFDADYGEESGYTSDKENCDYAWSWLSEAHDDLGGAAGLADEQLEAVEVAENECINFSNTLELHLRRCPYVDMGEVAENRREALRALRLAGLSKSEAATQIKAIVDEIAAKVEA